MILTRRLISKAFPIIKRLGLVITVTLLITTVFLKIWVLDIILDRTIVLAQAPVSSEQTLYLVQCWNHRDFYNTELILTTPNDIVGYTVIDADSYKLWNPSLEIDTRTITIKWLGNVRERQLQDVKSMGNRVGEPPPPFCVFKLDPSTLSEESPNFSLSEKIPINSIANRINP